MLVDLLYLAYQYALGIVDTVACVVTLLDRLILTCLVHGHDHEKGHLKLCWHEFVGLAHRSVERIG